jgi:phosphohistidine phosphatase
VIVGHEPHLGRLVSLLLTGDAERPLVLLKKGGAVCLRGEPGGGGGWLLEWALKPKLLSGIQED